MNSGGKLHGAGILITRPARQAAGLAREIATLGGKPLIFPAIVILPPDDRRALEKAQRELSSYDYAVFVSTNAVEYGVGDAAAWPPKLIAVAPGPGTAAALVAVGVSNVRVPVTTMDSEGLLELPEFQTVAGKRVVIFRGGGGRELLGETLASLGVEARQRFAAIPAFVPHARIAEHARRLGISRPIVTAPADAGLIAGLLEYFAAK